MIEKGEVTPGNGGIDDLGGGVTIKPAMTSFDVGAMQKTENDTDFAIHQADQFFVVVQRGNEQMLTRAGNFLFDSTGKLITQQGDAVLGSDGQRSGSNHNCRIKYNKAAEFCRAVNCEN